VTAARGKMSPAVRRRVMASIKNKDTVPELTLRAALWKAGLRGWRCHYRSPGSPDVAFVRWKVAVFVDGVWWHGHPDYLPRGRRGEYWDAKIARNIERDARVNTELEAMGWRVVRVWDLDVLAEPAAAVARVVEELKKAGWSRRRVQSGAGVR
jgi:DNA mismatch endonuclease (patch repair protein)